MAPKIAAVILHASAAVVMIYGYVGLEKLSAVAWIQDQKGGLFQFLTIQGLFVACLTMLVGLVLDFFPPLSSEQTQYRMRHLSKMKRLLFMLAMPVAVVVTSFYWTLLFARPALIGILKPDPDKPVKSPSIRLALIGLPLPLDLALHLVPFLSLFADFIIFESKYTDIEASYGVATVISLGSLWYSWWVEYCARFNDVFPYPFLDHPFGIRVSVYIVAAVLALFSFRFINGAHDKFNGR